VYGGDGSLRSIPTEEQYYGIDKTCFGLVPLGCDVWEGFVFVHYDPSPAEGLRTFLGELADRYAGYPFGQMTNVSAFGAVLKANWKTTADAFQESHHVPFIHGITMGDAFTSKENPYCHVKWAKLYDKHRSASVYGAPQMDRRLFPTERVAFAQFGAFTQGADAATDRFPGINPGKIDNWAFDINVIFPHFFLDPGTGQYFTMHFWPVDVHTTNWEFRLYMSSTTNAAKRVAQKYTDVVMRDAALEDLSTVEATQKMLESGAVRSLPLADQEILLRHNIHVIENALRAGPAAHARA
jgi:phenylpropionate dioxygenase-like ring-hydroxylating dioxygenase large terminal subunit